MPLSEPSYGWPVVAATGRTRREPLPQRDTQCRLAGVADKGSTIHCGCSDIGPAEWPPVTSVTRLRPVRRIRFYRQAGTGHGCLNWSPAARRLLARMPITAVLHHSAAAARPAPSL